MEGMEGYTAGQDVVQLGTQLETAKPYLRLGGTGGLCYAKYIGYLFVPRRRSDSKGHNGHYEWMLDCYEWILSGFEWISIWGCP